MKTQKKADGRKARNAARAEQREIEVGCLYVAPRKYWAVWGVGSNAPPCIAGSKRDAEELRDDDEIALPLIVVSPEWVACEIMTHLDDAERFLIAASKQPGYDLSGPVHKAAARLAFARIHLLRAL